MRLHQYWLPTILVSKHTYTRAYVKGNGALVPTTRSTEATTNGNNVAALRSSASNGDASCSAYALSSSLYCLLFGSGMLLGPSVSAVPFHSIPCAPSPLRRSSSLQRCSTYPAPSGRHLRRSCAGINAYARDTMYPGAL